MNSRNPPITEAQIIAFLDGTLNGFERDAVWVALAGDGATRALFEKHLLLRRGLHGLAGRSVEPPAMDFAALEAAQPRIAFDPVALGMRPKGEVVPLPVGAVPGPMPGPKPRRPWMRAGLPMLPPAAQGRLLEVSMWWHGRRFMVRYFERPQNITIGRSADATFPLPMDTAAGDAHFLVRAASGADVVAAPPGTSLRVFCGSNGTGYDELVSLERRVLGEGDRVSLRLGDCEFRMRYVTAGRWHRIAPSLRTAGIVASLAAHAAAIALAVWPMTPAPPSTAELSAAIDRADAGAAAPPAPATARRSRQAVVSAGEVEVGLGLDAGAIEATARAYLGELESCQSVGARLPHSAGGYPVVVNFAIGPDGRIKDAAVTGGIELQEIGAFEQCVLRSVESWVFPPPASGQSPTMAYTLNVKPRA